MENGLGFGLSLLLVVGANMGGSWWGREERLGGRGRDVDESKLGFRYFISLPNPAITAGGSYGTLRISEKPTD
jgi:hypothetical protein